MARRLPGIRQRMEAAAFELYREQGYASTTPVEIAARAGTTERTFYRHFGDRAGVVFGEEDEARALFSDRIARHQPEDPPFWTVCEAFRAASGPKQRYPVAFRERMSVVRESPELRDRDVVRVAAWGPMAVEGLGARGVDTDLARLAAAMGTAVFRLALDEWADGLAPVLSDRIAEVAHEAATLFGAPADRVADPAG